jgi:hypothetical protein
MARLEREKRRLNSILSEIPPPSAALYFAMRATRLGVPPARPVAHALQPISSPPFD